MRRLAIILLCVVGAVLAAVAIAASIGAYHLDALINDLRRELAAR